MSRSLSIAFVVVVLSAITGARAEPLQLTSAEFAAAIGGSAVVEDFEGFTEGFKPHPLVFANGRYSNADGSQPLITTNFGPTKELADNSLEATRTFDSFPADTELVGMDLNYVFLDDLFDVTVTGGSGTLNISQTGSSLGSFLGFQDPLGITSVEFLNHGHFIGGPGNTFGNYTFDDIQTSAGVIPEPTSIALLLISLATFMSRRR